MTLPGGPPSGLPSPVPRQLPRAATHFTDRIDARTKLDQLITADNAVAVISGPAGVGKSALAVHWAHACKDRFPDGQLYVNLCGYDHRPPLLPENALHGFLLALNAPVERVAGNLEAMAALFRGVADGRRILIVADNARSADQVRPLLPSAPGCFTLVTSRNRLSSLTAVDGATPLPVRPLDTEQALHLFERLSGHRDAPGAAELVRRCGRLPLFIRIAAERASAAADLRELVDDLTRDSDRLEALSTLDAGTDARIVLSWSYQQLPPAVGRAFRLLALHAGPDISVPAAAALLGRSPGETRRHLETLGSVNLLEELGDRRFRFHDILKDYARERVREEETAADRTSAVRRELLYYLAGADACDRVLVPARQHVPLDRDIDQDVPVFAGFEEALAWCTSELGCLVAAVDQAVELGFDDVAWKLPVALVYFLRLQRRDTYRYDLSRAAVGAARREGDSWAETWSLICLGGAASDLERHEEALRAFGEALRISRETGEPTWEAVSVYNLGWTLRLQGRFTEALEHQRRALALHEAAGDLRSSSITLTEVAALELALGRSPEAYDAFGLALERARAVDDLPTEAKALHGLGDVSRATARTDLARDWYARAVQVSRRVGDRFGLACSQFELGKLLLTLDLTDEAVETLRKALTLLETLQDPLADEVRRVLEEAGGIPG